MSDNSNTTMDREGQDGTQAPVTGKCERGADAGRPCRRNAAIRTMDGRGMCRQHADITNEETHGPVLAAQRGALIRKQVYADPLFWLTGPHHLGTDEDLGSRRALYRDSPPGCNWHYGNPPSAADFRTIPPLTLEQAAAQVRSARETVAAATPPATERRLPSEPSPRGDVLRLHHAADRRYPDDGLDRARYWRVQLDCGHVRDWLTYARGLGGIIPADGRGKTPAEQDGWFSDYHDYRSYLGRGYTTCDHEDCEELMAAVYGPVRDILTWGHPVLGENKADPEEAPDWFAEPREEQGRDVAAEWAKCRQVEPDAYVAWQVLLSCGHKDTVYVDAPLWSPEDGTVPNPGKVAEVAARWATHDRDGGRKMPDTVRRWISDGGPEPRPYKACEVCAAARRITAFEYHGPLSVPAIPATRRELAALERRVTTAEAKARELRDELREREAGRPAPWPRHQDQEDS